MEYSYIIPIKLKYLLVNTLEANNQIELAKLINKSKIECKDVGLAYYAGLRGDNWDKHAMDCNIHLKLELIEEISKYKDTIKTWISRLLPIDSGLLVRNIIFIPNEENFDVNLPYGNDCDLQTLSKDIDQALSRNEPTLVLDRLHTFAVKYIRRLCQEKRINVNDCNGDFYPLHSLAGMLAL